MTIPLARPTRSTVLVVDDEAMSRDLIARILRDRGFAVHAVSSTAEAHAELASGLIDLMVCDVVMPDESGTEFLLRLHERRPDLPVVMVSGIDNTTIAQLAVELGADAYVTKPFSASQLVVAVTNALHRRALDRARPEFRPAPAPVADAPVVARAGALSTAEAATVALAQAIEGRDIEDGEHVVRVGRYAGLLADALGLGAEHCEQIRAGAVLHDVGKVCVPTEILLNPAALTPAEYETVKQHAEVGYRILSRSGEPSLALAASIARTHHERWDGTGYPRGLAGPAIPIEGRIVAVADVFDVLMSPSVYRSSVALDLALEIMRAGECTQFDPDVLRAFLDRVDDFARMLATA